MSSQSSLYSRCRLRAEEVAFLAGAKLKEAQNRRRRVDYKGAINLVTEMDRKVERLIARELSRSFPDHDFLAEEGERNLNSGSEFRWIVDPLDGTTNYAHRLPIYCVSIALEHRGRIVLGVVYQPVTDELFAAQTGWGARLNGKRISVSGETRLEHSLLVTGFPYDIRTTREDNLENFRRFAKRARAVRRLGSAALDLCYLACGRFDGFWELKLLPWDLAAGSLVAAEAGAKLSTIKGERFTVYGGSVLAATPRLHRAMLNVLR